MFQCPRRPGAMDWISRLIPEKNSRINRAEALVLLDRIAVTEQECCCSPADAPSESGAGGEAAVSAGSSRSGGL